jgi:hypothetical protein
MARLNDETATQVDDGVSLSAQRGRAHLSRATVTREQSQLGRVDSATALARCS